MLWAQRSFAVTCILVDKRNPIFTRFFERCLRLSCSSGLSRNEPLHACRIPPNLHCHANLQKGHHGCEGNWGLFILERPSPSILGRKMILFLSRRGCDSVRFILQEFSSIAWVSKIDISSFGFVIVILKKTKEVCFGKSPTLSPVMK